MRHVRSTMLGQIVNVTPCDRCKGTGKIVDTPCHTCHGDGRVERKRKLRVTIPAGIDDSHQIRLSGEGEAAPRGGVPGNLYVVVHVTPHPHLRRQDTELFYELPLSITQAALGARVTGPDRRWRRGDRDQAGTQPGAEIRLRGKGVPHLRRPASRGDLHVMVDVRVPTRLSARRSRPPACQSQSTPSPPPNCVLRRHVKAHGLTPYQAPTTVEAIRTRQQCRQCSLDDILSGRIYPFAYRAAILKAR